METKLRILIVKASPVELSAKTTVEQAIQTTLANCLSHIDGNAEGLVRGADPESVHQMRIGLRRLHAALNLFEQVAPWPNRLLQELEWLEQLSGAARDWEVLSGATVPKLAEENPEYPALAALQQQAFEIAAKKRRTAAAAVSSARYAKLLLALNGWISSRRWRESIANPELVALSTPIAEFAHRALGKGHAKLLKRGNGLHDMDPRGRHRVRIAAKRMRYATEFFQSLYGRRKTRSYLDKLAAIQDVLGTINDRSVAVKLLDAISARHPELAGAGGYVQGYLMAQTETEIAQIDKLWKRYESTSVPWD